MLCTYVRDLYNGYGKYPPDTSLYGPKVGVFKLNTPIRATACVLNEATELAVPTLVCTPSRGQRNKSTKKYLNLPSNNDHAFPSVSKRQGYAGDVSCCSNGYNCESFSPVQYDS